MRQTSIDAYNALEASGALSDRRWEAYDALYHRGPLTGQELARETGVAGMWKRCSELRDMGLVYEVGTRICKVTKQNAIVWDVTSQSKPVPRRKPLVYFGVKVPGKAGRFWHDEAKAKRIFKETPGSVLITLVEKKRVTKS